MYRHQKNRHKRMDCGGWFGMRMSRRAGIYSQGGKLWLYKEGNECIAVTGGWLGSNLYKETVRLRKYSGSSTTSYAYTTNTIDVTAYSTLYFDGYYVGKRSGLAVLSTEAGNSGTNMASVTINDNTRSVVSCDISLLSGLYYIKFSSRAYSSDDTANTYCYNYWLE